MAWTDPKTWADGDVVTASELNTHVRDNLNELRGAQTCRVYRSVTQSLSNDTYALIGMNQETSDVPGWHSTVTNDPRITPTVAGLYLIVAGASFAHNTTGSREIVIVRNGLGGVSVASTGRNIAVNAAGSLSANFNVTGVFPANGSTDYFSLAAWQNSGGALNVNGGEFLTWLSVTFLGA